MCADVWATPGTEGTVNSMNTDTAVVTEDREGIRGKAERGAREYTADTERYESYSC